MELSHGITIQLVVLLLIFKMSWAAEVPIASDQMQAISNFEDENSNIPGEEKRGVGTRDLVRMFLMAIHNNYPNGVHYGRVGGIPFRPVRRIGSEFLGKRSIGRPFFTSLNLNDDEIEKLLQNPEKRVRQRMGSEFLGKRRLGSEFLGKRTPNLSYGMNSKDNYHEDSEEMEGLGAEATVPEGKNSLMQIPFTESSDPRAWERNTVQPEAHFKTKYSEKRALGNEFLGKRKYGPSSGPYDWAWKRARLGSEFLGKRALGSEFLGKRASPPTEQQDQSDAELGISNSV